MKTYCKPKQINIEDYHFNVSAVANCICGKEKRKDFQRLILSTGVITKEELLDEIENGEFNKRAEAWEKIAEILTERIINRDLKLPKVLKEFQRADSLSGKVRTLTKETPEQQCYEYIAVKALQPLFKAKILPFQYGSIPKRGQVLGKRRIERLIRKKFRENIDCVKCDVRHAYKSTTISLIMRFLKRDIGKNKTLLWFLESLMSNYPNGVLIIGGYLPTWLFNYIMSYFLRFLMSDVKIRRGYRIPTVRGIVCYADDFIVFGKSKSLLRLMKKADKWIKSNLGLTIKQGWQVIHISTFDKEKENHNERYVNKILIRTEGIDMMGYYVRKKYTIIRKRIFKRIRRLLLRVNSEIERLGYVPWWRAQKIMCYKGYLKYTNSRMFCDKLNVWKILKLSKRSLSYKFGAKEAFA